MDYRELINKEVELHEDLKPYVETGSFLPMLRHPLVYHVPYSEQMNGMINNFYTHKKEAAEKSLKERDYSKYIWLHERAYRVNAFSEVESYLSDKSYWGILGTIWIDSENIYQNLTFWNYFLKKDRDGKKHFMSDEDLGVFNKFPETITVYRGCKEGQNENGYSYTTDESIASWFANRFNNGTPKVVELTVKKEDILAYTNSRGEKEVIIVKK